MRRWTATLPLLLLVGLLLLVAGWKAGLDVLTGAGLVLVGMWSGTAVADLFIVVARPSHQSEEEDE